MALFVLHMILLAGAVALAAVIIGVMAFVSALWGWVWER